MADQMAPQLTGPYGNREVKTPHLDRLAREGVVFQAAYSNCPLCVPARVALMSGRYPSRLGVYDNASVLSSEVPTICYHLRVANYETVLSGKMHFVGADQLHGGELRLTEDIYPADFAWTPRWEAQAVLNPRGTPKARLVLDARVQASGGQMRYDDHVQEESLAFLRSRPQVPASQRRPFFLCVSFSDPHGPYQVPRELWDLYADVPITVPEIPDDLAAHESTMDRWINVFHGVDKVNLRDREALYRFRRVYYGQITYIDRKVGALLDCLREMGELEHTAVFFTSDHGDMAAERTMVEKRTFYEFSARVPLIARLPARWQAGCTCAEPVSLVDIFPTLTELAGAPAPLGIDGRSLLNLLEGRPDSGTPRTAVSEYHGEGVLAPCFMIREGDFKYVHITGGGRQLFHLRDDPGEWKNLAGEAKYRDAETRLSQRLLRQFDPPAIDAAVRISQQRRLLMKAAMTTGRPTRWDYHPPADK
jgi:choline-sulfatase